MWSARSWIAGVAVALAIVPACAHAAAGGEPSWLPLLRQVLAAEKRCNLEHVVWVRELPVGDSIALDGRVRCYDGREFDFARPRPHLKFEVRLCQPAVC